MELGVMVNEGGIVKHERDSSFPALLGKLAGIISRCLPVGEGGIEPNDSIVPLDLENVVVNSDTAGKIAPLPDPAVRSIELELAILILHTGIEAVKVALPSPSRAIFNLVHNPQAWSLPPSPF